MIEISSFFKFIKSCVTIIWELDGMKKLILYDKIIIIIGTFIVAFAMNNIHARFGISEGGQLGVELLFYNWFNISPAISSIVIDMIFYTIGFLVFGKRFLINAITGTISYSLFYYMFQNMPYLLPNFENNMLIISIVGGILIGIGCGMVVKMHGTCGGDDAAALTLSKITKIPISICYFIMDVIVISLSLTYININNVWYSLLTSFISSIIIGIIYNKEISVKK